MNYRELNNMTIRQGFEKFNRENPHVFESFKEQAFKAINQGKKKISSKDIINYLRWHEYLKTTDSNFTINDAYHSYYSRHFVEKYPEYKHLFEFRKLRNEEEGPYIFVEEIETI